MTSITIPEGASIQESTRKVYSVTTSTTGPFTIPFPYFVDTDIVVYEGGVLQSQGSDYTLTGTVVQDGFSSGEITFLVAIADTDVIIQRAVPIERVSDFVATGPFPMRALNLVLDKIYAIEQQLRTSLYRSLRLADTETSVSEVTIENPEAGKVLQWNATADGFVNGTAADTVSGAAYQSEIIAATAGQTDFTLTQFTYTPGAYNLAVYINGVRQNHTAYTETSSSTVRFVSGLNVNDEVEFVTGVTVTTTAGNALTTAYMPTGAGAVATNVAAKLGEAVSVLDFGAVEGGVVSCTAAFNLAFQYIRDAYDSATITYPMTLIIPPGQYLIDGYGIDAQSIRGHGWEVRAEGAQLLGNCTGYPVIDALDSRFGKWHGITIWGDVTNTPSIGFLIGRAAVGTSRVADCHKVYAMSLTGYYSVACMANLGSETCAFFAPTFLNRHNSMSSYCVIQDGVNHLDIQSYWATANGIGVMPVDVAVSFNENCFYEMDARKETSGPCLFIARAGRHRFISSYAVSFDDAVIDIFCQGFQNPELYLDIHCETAQGAGALYAIRFITDPLSPTVTPTLFGLTYTDNTPQVSEALFKADASITTVNLIGAHIAAVTCPSGFSDKMFSTGVTWNVTGSIRTNDPAKITGLEFFRGKYVVDDWNAADLPKGTIEIESLDSYANRIKGTVEFLGQSVVTLAAADIALVSSVSISNGTISFNAQTSGDSWLYFYENRDDAKYQSAIRHLESDGSPGTAAVEVWSGGDEGTATDATKTLAIKDTGITMQEAKNIILGTTTGTKIGTAASQKLGFHGATPIIRQTTTSQTPATFAANTSGIANDSATWNGYTIGDLVAIMQAYGLLT